METFFKVVCFLSVMTWLGGMACPFLIADKNCVNLFQSMLWAIPAGWGAGVAAYELFGRSDSRADRG